MREKLYNRLIEHSPAWIQILFMERVLKSVKASLPVKAEAGKVLLSKKEGNLRAGRRYQPSNPFRTPRMDLLGLPQSNQSQAEVPSLHGRDR